MNYTFTFLNFSRKNQICISALLTMLLVVISSIAPVTAQQYTLTDDDVVVTDGVIQSCSYDFAIKDIIIPETLDGQTVTGIADTEWYDGVFGGHEIVSVRLPLTLKNIGDQAFIGNTLTSITIPNSVTRIGNSAFHSNSLKSVTFEAKSNIGTIGAQAFDSNAGLTSITLPTHAHPNFINYVDGSNNTFNPGDAISDFSNNYYTNATYTLSDVDVVVTDGVIQSCNYDFSFKIIVIPQVLDGQTITGIADKDWDNGVFYKKGIVNVQLPATLEKIGDYAFSSNYSMTSVTIPSSVRIIGYCAFMDNGLTSVAIPNNVASIGDNAFDENSLTNVTIPNNVTMIGAWAFARNSLTSVTFEPNSSIRLIGEEAFYDNASLSSITLPSNINPGFSGYYNGNDNGYVAGDNIIDFNTDYYAKLPTNTLTLDDVEFADGRITDYYGGYVDIIIPQSFNLNGTNLPVTTIEYLAFGFNSLRSVSIPNGVTTIGFAAFFYNSIKSITIPKTLTAIGNASFNNNSISFINGEASNGIIFARNSDGSEDNTSIVSYGGIATDIDFIPNSVTTVGDYSFYENSLTNVTIPNNVKTIGDDAFADNSLTSITIPNSVTIIGVDAFAYNLLTNITIPNSVITIGDYAFAENSLTSVTLPSPVIKEGYTFTEWLNGSGVAVNEITNFVTSYEAQFKLSGLIVSGRIIIDNLQAAAMGSIKSVATDNMEGVILYISGDFTGTRPVNADGTYSFALNAGRSIVITPIKEGYTFTPATININNIQADLSNQDFAPIVTAINNLSASTIKVYPNPVNQLLTIETSGKYKTISVINVAGNIQKIIDCRNIANVQIDMEALVPGVYFIRLQGTDGETEQARTVIRKVLKR